MSDGLAFPKPFRCADKRLIASYRRLYPRCQVQGCRSRGTPEVHHLVPVGRYRDDRHENLLTLCPEMHAEWGLVRGRRWLAKYESRLEPWVIAKVRAALRMDEDD